MSPRPVVLAGVAAVGFGLALFCIDRGARSSTLMTLWGMRGVSFVVFVTLALVLRSRGGVVARELPALLAIGCGDMGANLLFAIASSRGQVSVASVLGSLYPVVTILLARVILKERLRRIQQVGARPLARGRGDHRALSNLGLRGDLPPRLRPGPRCPPRARDPHAGVVHAPGGALAAGVPRGP